MMWKIFDLSRHQGSSTLWKRKVERRCNWRAAAASFGLRGCGGLDGWSESGRGGVALECFVLQMTAALILHYELLQGGSTPFVPICLMFVAPSWS
eukprot:scaffold1815_cov147-Skeletonema_dohrnii-CCMP3373.AAC.1